LQQLFGSLSAALEGSAFLALAASLIWGVLSVLLSPCHLSSIPLIVAYVGSGEQKSARRTIFLSLLFSVGILLSIALIGAITAAAGMTLGNLGSWANYVVAAVFLLVGLYLLEAIPLPWDAPAAAQQARKGYWGALFLGLFFGIALGPCTFAFMVPLLAVVFKVGTTRPVFAAGLILLYAIGHCLILVLAGASTGLVQRYLDWNRKSHGAILARRFCGFLIILVGLYLLYRA
jgi:cytochrome c-type biogenesis protein